MVNPSLSFASVSLRELLPALFRQGQLSWNPTVNKMTALALKAFLVRVYFDPLLL
jgi:hypothetical protein